VIYRPQFPYPTPEGFQDEEFEYYYDSSNTPALNTANLSVGQIVANIPLPLQQDAPFFWRGLILDNPKAAFGVRFRDAAGNYLSDDFVNVGLYSPIPPGSQHPPVGNAPIAIEPEIPCPLGGVLYVDIKRLN
jgi:hypothetical protein